MNSIVGKIKADSMKPLIYKMKGKKRNNSKLNLAYYGQWYREHIVKKKKQIQHEGAADECLYMAMTTNENVAPFTIETCETEKKKVNDPLPLMCQVLNIIICINISS